MLEAFPATCQNGSQGGAGGVKIWKERSEAQSVQSQKFRTKSEQMAFLPLTSPLNSTKLGNMNPTQIYLKMIYLARKTCDLQNEIRSKISLDDLAKLSHLSRDPLLWAPHISREQLKLLDNFLPMIFASFDVTDEQQQMLIDLYRKLHVQTQEGRTLTELEDMLIESIDSMSAEDIEAALREAGIDMTPAIIKLRAMIATKLEKQ